MNGDLSGQGKLSFLLRRPFSPYPAVVERATAELSHAKTSQQFTCIASLSCCHPCAAWDAGGTRVALPGRKGPVPRASMMMIHSGYSRSSCSPALPPPSVPPCPQDDGVVTVRKSRPASRSLSGTTSDVHTPTEGGNYTTATVARQHVRPSAVKAEHRPS